MKTWWAKLRTWTKGLVLALGAFLLMVGFAIFNRDEKRAKKAQETLDNTILDGSKKAQKKIDKADKVAKQAKEDAFTAAAEGRKALDKVGAKNETAADIMDRWRIERMRS